MFGCTSITHVSSLLVGALFSSRTQITSPALTFVVGVVYLLNLCSWLKYSAHHRCQKCWTRLWQSPHCRRRDMSIPDVKWSGRACIGLPMRNWPGISTSAPFLASERGVSDLEIRHTSISAKMVIKFSNMRYTFPTILRRWYLKLFVAASHRPPKCGTCSGMKCHWMFWNKQNSEMLHHTLEP